MNKSIRILNLVEDLTREIENHNIYKIEELIANIDSLNISDDNLIKIKKILNAHTRAQIKNEILGKEDNEKCSFLNAKYSLEDLDLSLRAMNAITAKGITTVAELLGVVHQLEIYNIENLGSKSVVNVLEAVSKIVHEEKLEKHLFVYEDNKFLDRVKVENMGFNLSAITSLKNLGLNTFGSIRKAYISGKLSELFNYQTLRAVIERVKNYYIINSGDDYSFFKLFLINDNFGQISLTKFKEFLKEEDIEASYESFINKIKNRDDLIVNDKYIRLPYFMEKLNTVVIKKESKEILIKRFEGLTLQEVATIFSKTRERIRQIVRDRMSNIKMFYEEAFIKEYNKFNYHPEIFKMIFGLNDFSYNLVKYFGKGYPFEMEYDFPEDYILTLIEEGVIQLKSIESIKEDLADLFPKTINIYGTTVDKLTKREFLEYVIKHFIPSEGMHKFKIIKVANKVAKENNLDYSFDKYIDIVTNTVQGLQNVRYYDYSIVDKKLLSKLREILLSVDSVYSCTYFYLENSEFLNKYNILDGYELHFILRRYFQEDKEILEHVEFNRQPMIAKKGMQFKDVVTYNWQKLTYKIELNKFVEDLVNNYGYHRGTLINTINANLGNYISLGVIYPYEAKLNEAIREKVKEILVDDFYELQEIKQIFKKNGINEVDYKYFSTDWLVDFGYKTHDVNYILKSEFTSLKEVFYNKVLKNNVYEITKKDHKMKETTLILFLENLRESYLAFLGKDNLVYTMSYLEKLGISMELLKAYVDELSKYIPKETYFTYYYLKKNNYEKNNQVFMELEALNLDEELMTSIIRNIPGIKKTTKGNLFKISKKSTTISEFIKIVRKDLDTNDFNKVKKYVEENYGMSIRNYSFS